MSGGRYSPWQHMAQLPHLRLAHERLDGLDSLYDPDEHLIVLDPRLGQSERRCALAHELVHAEEEHEAQQCPVLAARQEAHTDRVASERLITVDDLVDALMWARDEHELAEELWCDVHTVRSRLAALTDEEHELIRKALWEREESA